MQETDLDIHVQEGKRAVTTTKKKPEQYTKGRLGWTCRECRVSAQQQHLTVPKL